MHPFRHLIRLVEAAQRAYYHVTLSKNIPDIQKQGLLPQIGPLSILAGEAKPTIFLFPNLETVEDALMNWLGDYLPDEPLALLKVVLPPGARPKRSALQDEETGEEIGYEFKVYVPISPENLEVLSMNVDHFQFSNDLHESAEMTPAQTMIEAFEDAFEQSPIKDHVSVNLWHSEIWPPDQVEIASIGTEKDSRNQGYGNEAMAMICQFADKFQITLTLGVANDANGEHNSLTVSQLRNWYEKWGFEGGHTMKRYPDEPLDEEYSEDDVASRREKMRGKPLQGFTVIYRALIATDSTFVPMCYVTTRRRFAIGHAEHMAVTEGEDYHVIRKMVDGKDVYEAPNPGEYFYDGPETTGREIYVAKA